MSLWKEKGYITNYILFNKKVWGGLYNRIEKLI